MNNIDVKIFFQAAMFTCDSDRSPNRIFGLVGIASSIIETVGLFGNAVSILVLIRKFLKQDIFRFFLSALCLCDMGTLICALFMFTVPEFVYSTVPNGDLLMTVNFLVLIAFPIGIMLKTASSWLVAVMSIYRFLYVKKPMFFQ